MPSPVDYRKTAYTHRRGTRADQPLATDVLDGTLYYVTDELKTERSNGAIWEDITDAGGGGVINNYYTNQYVLGLDGYDGIDGIDGFPGVAGSSGPAGSSGSPGPTGQNGISGIDGEDGIDGFPGPIGPQGPAGTAGTIGVNGAPGPPGLDAEEVEFPYIIPGPKGETGAAGAPGSGVTTLRTTGNQTINAGVATYTDVTGLTFPVVSGSRYAFYFYIVFQSAQLTTGWKASVNCPAGTLDFHHLSQIIANAAAGAATWTERHSVTRDDMTLLTGTVTAGVDLINIIQGRYLCTANGTFAVRFANELANTDITIREGSWGYYF
jgi:hypothetical protein